MAQTKVTDRQKVDSIDLTSEVGGVLPIANGGTGNTTNDAASCSGNSATATALANTRTISGQSFNGTANITITRDGIPENASSSSATTLTLTTGKSAYIFTGSSAATWTLPAVAGTGAPLILSNIGTASVTVQRAGTDQIWGVGGAQTSFTLKAGDEIQLFDGGGYWILYSLAVGAINATGTASSSTHLRGDGAWSSVWANPTITGYTESVNAVGTVGSTSTLSLSSGTVITATLTSATACTFTMPTAVAGQSFVLLLKQPASGTATTATFTGVKWPTAGAPTITATVGKMDILTFVSDGTNWYGSYVQGYTY